MNHNKTTISRVLTLGTPLLFAQLMRYFHQVADSAMLGHFGEGSDELAAIGIASLFTWILITMLWPLSNGVQAITARRFGRQSEEDPQSKILTGEALDNGIFTATYTTVIVLALSFLAGPVLSALIQTPRILELSLEYIRIMRFGLLPTGLFIVMQGFLGAINKTAYVMCSGIISNVLNVILNYILIFGAFGLPPMGIRGAALGTVISLYVSFIFLFVVVIARGYARTYRLFTFRHLTVPLQRDIIKVALPPGIQNVIALSIFMIYQTLIEDYSTGILAATHIAFSFFRLNKTLIGGFARSAGILIGNAFGRNDREDAKKLMAAGGIIAALIALGVVLFTVLGRDIIAALFTSDLPTRESAARALLFLAPFFFVESLGYAFEMVFIVNGYGKYVLISEFSTNIIFIIGATLVVRLLFPGEVLFAWLSFGLYQIVHAILMFIAYRRGKWLNVEVESTKQTVGNREVSKA